MDMNDASLMSSLQNQISGNHYKRCKIQPVEFIHANAIPHLEACVIRYVVRHRHKNKADDLRKAKHYIEILLELEYGEKGDPAHQPAPETVVCQDWHGAVREMRSGTPNIAMSAVIAPTPSTPGWLDKAAEALAEKHVDSDEEIYQWGGGRWCVMDDKTWCWNARECAWNESTMLPEQLRQDGTRTN